MIKNILHKNLYKQAAFILSCLFIFGCENDPETIKNWTQNKQMVEEVKNVETLMSEGGRMKAKLTAPYMLRHEADTVYVEFPQSLKVNFYDSAGRVESHLTAKYGKYFESLNKVFLRDSVVVYNIKGDTLRSPELWWDQNKQKFYTDKRVRIHKAGDLIYGGQGLEAKQDLTEIIIKQPTGVVIVPDSLSVK
jgi:LPS export ABC transporter protein LptC